MKATYGSDLEPKHVGVEQCRDVERSANSM